MDRMARGTLVFVCSAVMATVLGCDSDSNGNESAATAGSTTSAGNGGSGGSSQGGLATTAGTAGSAMAGEPSDAAGSGGVTAGGAVGDSGAAGFNAGSGGANQASCTEGVAGVWMIPGYPAYLQINESCEVTLFCDLDKAYHTTGYLEGDVITLTGVATVNYTVMGNLLTLIDATSTGDVNFARQASADVIPAECY